MNPQTLPATHDDCSSVAKPSARSTAIRAEWVAIAAAPCSQTQHEAGVKREKDRKLFTEVLLSPEADC